MSCRHPLPARHDDDDDRLPTPPALARYARLAAGPGVSSGRKAGAQRYMAIEAPIWKRKRGSDVT